MPALACLTVWQVILTTGHSECSACAHERSATHTVCCIHKVWGTCHGCGLLSHLSHEAVGVCVGGLMSSTSSSSFNIAKSGWSRLVQHRQIGLVSSRSTSPNRAGLVLFSIAKSGWSRPVQYRQIGLFDEMTVALSVTVTVPVTVIVAVSDSTPRVKMRF